MVQDYDENETVYRGRRDGLYQVEAQLKCPGAG